MNWLLVVLGIVANAAASILVKIAGRNAPPASGPILALASPLLVLAVASYGLAFVLYSLALTRLPLNVAHPIMTAGAIILVGLSSVLVFGEPLPPTVAFGYAMLLGGIVLISIGGQWR